jgi:hypothetical protein
VYWLVAPPYASTYNPVSPAYNPVSPAYNPVSPAYSRRKSSPTLESLSTQSPKSYSNAHRRASNPSPKTKNDFFKF